MIAPHIRDLVNDRQMLKDIELQIDDLQEVFQQVEERGTNLGHQMEKVAQVEAWVMELNLLVEDVSAKHESLTVERDVLDRANARISELRSILQEAERRVERA